MAMQPPANGATPVLEIRDLVKQFGGLKAVNNFNLTVQQGELAGLIGPNGAGKTTVFNMITGLYVPTAGEILFYGESLAGLEPFEVTQQGIGRTFQNIRLFPSLTVMDNVRIAYHPHAGYGLQDGILTAIGVSFFLEYYGQLQFVFSAQKKIYQRPFEVVTWYIGSNGIHMVESGKPVPAGSITFSNIFLIIMVVSILMQLLLQFIVRRTKIGKAMRATSFDKPTARLMGINVDFVISFTFAIGAAFAGLGGVLFAVAYPSISSLLGILPGLKAFVAAVLGGIGSIPGALVGALIMGQAENLTAGYLSTPMRDAVAFTILILVLLIRPTGIFGEPEKEKV